MKQEVNRKHASDKWALDDVVMTSEVTHPPKVSVCHMVCVLAPAVGPAAKLCWLSCASPFVLMTKQRAAAPPAYVCRSLRT